MEKLCIAIVDDDPGQREQLEALANRYGKNKALKIQVETFENGFQFLDEYDARFDVVVLDILMNYMDGMETARRLRKLDEDVPLIFATTVAQYAIAGYEVGAMAFMLKPVSYEEFAMKMDRVQRIIVRRPQAAYPAALNGKLVMIPLRTVRYVEVMNHNLIFHGEGETYTVYGAMNSLEGDDRFSQFAKSSASHLVNCHFVSEVGADSLVVDGVAIPLSRRRRKDFLQEMAQILGGRP